MENTSKAFLHKIENASGFYVLVMLAMLYMSIMICNAVLTNEYIGSNHFFILGGTLTSPFIFILDDIVAEIYGYKITRFMIVCAFSAQTIFALICQLVIWAPHPIFLHDADAYSHILGSSLLRINFSGFIAYITANLINSYILTRWKVLLKGRKFWLRSVGSSITAEALYSFIAILLMEINQISTADVMKLILISYAIKVSYSIIFAAPAQKLVSYIKEKTGIDVYDEPKRFTSFRYIRDNDKSSGTSL